MADDYLNLPNLKFTKVFYKALIYQISVCIMIEVLFIQTVFSNHHRLVFFYKCYNLFSQEYQAFKDFNNFHQIKIIYYLLKIDHLIIIHSL